MLTAPQALPPPPPKRQIHAVNWFRRVLAATALGLLAFLVWNLINDWRDSLQQQQRESLSYSQQLATQASRTMRMSAAASHAIVFNQSAHQEISAQISELQGIFPSVHSLALFEANGRRLLDNAPEHNDLAVLNSLLHSSKASNAPYYYSINPRNDTLYLLLRHNTQAAAIVRMELAELKHWFSPPHHNHFAWLVEDHLSRRALARSTDAHTAAAPSAVTADEQSNTLQSFDIDNSNWRLRALQVSPLDTQEGLNFLSAKLLMFSVLSILVLIALLGLQHERRRLQRLNDESRRSLRYAGSALSAVDEAILLTQVDGKLRYANPQAEALLGVELNAVQGRHILELLPNLDLFKFSSPHNEPAGDLIRLQDAHSSRLYSVNRRELHDNGKHAGYVWVLRDITADQRALEVQEQTRQHYQDIFEDSGIALCVLDLSTLNEYLNDLRLRDIQALDRWLAASSSNHSALLLRLHLLEANQVALNLFGAHNIEQAWNQLFSSNQVTPDSLAYRLACALIAGPNLLELESQIRTCQGIQCDVWMVARLPSDSADYHSVTLSIGDITRRKRTEQSILERERFWSEVVRSVPDLLYVQDLESQQILFSNHALGAKLGYKPEDIDSQKDFWLQVLHPDDQDFHLRCRRLLQNGRTNKLQESEVRLRQRNGQWRWVSMREQALARNEHGQVTRLIGLAKDVTERLEQTQSLRDSEQRYRLLAESISDVILSTDSHLQLNYISPSIEPVLGYSPAWFSENSVLSIAGNSLQLEPLVELFERIREALDDRTRLTLLRNQLPDQVFVFDCLHANGHTVPIELRLVLMWDDNGRFEGLLAVARDISHQRRAEKDLRMAATVFEHSSAAILVTDPAGYIVQVNKAFSRITGYPSGQVLDQRAILLPAEHTQSAHIQYVLEQLKERGSWEGELWLKNRDEHRFPAWVGINAIFDEEGDLVSYVSFFSDISERKASEQRIHRLAYYDALTNLPNRTLFQDRLHSALQHAERHDEWVVLMFLDLDRFKPINDSLGHAAGDRMLKEVAQRLTGCVNPEDTVARMGGDEFTLLLQPCDSRSSALNRAIHVGEKILSELARAFVLEGREFFVSASIGIALAPQDGNELSLLMKNADTAMYHAKECGKNNFQFYQAEMNASALERLELESDLRHAQEQQQFSLHYQPQFSGDGLHLTGAEALLRWNHPTRGMVAPHEFIPVLEELGLIVQVGDWVINEACRQLQSWEEAGLHVPKISVNLSARQFAEDNLSASIARIISTHGVDARRLEVELTESTLMRDVKNAMQALEELKALGLSIAIDDFGTGYSSLNYLKQFPIDVLKIDRTFVDGLPDGEQDAQIARAIIAMAHSLNMMVIAEGVETTDQLEFLHHNGCDEIQGYLLGRPMSANAFHQEFSVQVSRPQLTT